MKKRKLLLLLIILATILLTKHFVSYIKSSDSDSVESPARIFTDKEIMAIVTERIIYERENLRYYQQEDEFKSIIDKFHEKEASLNVLAKNIIPSPGVMFNLNQGFAKHYSRMAGFGRRHLMVLKDGTPSFRYSDLKTYMNVRTDKETMEALKDVNKELFYMNCYQRKAVFQLSGRYFNENERVEYTYYRDKDHLGYLTQGYRVAEGWTIEMFGYNQHYKYYHPAVNYEVYSWDINDHFPF